MEVDAGVAEPAGAVQEDGAHESVGRFDAFAGVAATDEAGVGFEVALDLVAGGVEGVLDLAGVVVGAERPHERDRLRRRQREVEAGDGGVVRGQPEAVGMDAVERVGQRVAIGDAGEAVVGGEAADPSAGRGAVLGEVVLSAVDDLAFVVVEVSALGDREHGGLLAPRCIGVDIADLSGGRISWRSSRGRGGCADRVRRRAGGGCAR